MGEHIGITRRRFMGLAATTGTAVVLAACQPAPAPTKAPDKPVAPAAQPTSPPAPAKKVALKFISPSLGGGQLEWFEKEVVPAFLQEFPSVGKVEFIATDYGKINEQLLAAFAAGDPPDIFEHGSAASGASWAASGQTLALDEFYARLDAKRRDDYYKQAIETCYHKGKLYSMPRLITPQTLAYRKDFFQEAGLDPAKGPETWEDLLAMARKLTKTEGGKLVRAGLRCPDKGWGLQQGWWPLVYQNGSSILTDDLSKVAFDSPAGLEAMNWYHDLIWKEKVDISGGLPAGVSGSPVNTGQAAMAWESAGLITQAKTNFPDAYPNLGFFLPTKRVRRACMLAVDRGFIGAKSKNPAEAWDFLMFTHRPEMFLGRFRVSGTLPPTKSFQETQEVKSEPLMAMVLKVIEYGYQWPPTPKWNDFRSHITTMSDAFMAQPGPVDQIVKDAAKEINAVLAKS